MVLVKDDTTQDIESGRRNNRMEEVDTSGPPCERYLQVPEQRPIITRKWNRKEALVVLIIAVGVVASSLALGLGISAKEHKESEHFVDRASELVRELVAAWNTYETKALWAYQTACAPRERSRTKFREAYEFLRHDEVAFQAVSCAFNITNEERPALEEEARLYFQQDQESEVSYGGFTGLEPDPEDPGSLTVSLRSEQPFYFPVRLIEPIKSNEAAIDFDLYSSLSRRETIETAIRNWKPTLTKRLRLVQETVSSAYSVILMHPGIPVTSVDPDRKPRDLATLVIRIPDLLKLALRHQVENVAVFIFDSSPDNPSPEFLGASSKTSFLSETDIATARTYGEKRVYEEVLSVASREWAVVVVPTDGAFKSNITFVAVGAVMILAAFVCLAWCTYASMRRAAMVYEMQQMKADRKAETAALLAESAKASARSERELNDFIAHEVRNPLSAALSALNFVSLELEKDPPLSSPESRQAVNEDVHIVNSSLRFINDLLRNMLDCHRAANNQLKIEKAPLCVMKDVFEPVSSMLYQRGQAFEVQLECIPSNLVVSADRLRLAQVVLNLSRNAQKFTTTGFIRLKAHVVDNSIRLHVEDSGPGIPIEKRNALFSKFQESLDSLSQGTGIGLSLSKNLVDLFEAKMWLDETYDSGVEGNPGTRFVIDLNTPPLELHAGRLDAFESNQETSNTNVSLVPSLTDDSEVSEKQEDALSSAAGPPNELPLLPHNLKVLIVDDDLVLRKLFIRGIRRVDPTWDVQEAASGEAALQMVASHSFDLIFLDQYMASIEKQLLGTETVAALRSRGVTCRICGLSANDLESSFLGSGSDFFILKPIPANKDDLSRELCRVVLGERHWKLNEEKTSTAADSKPPPDYRAIAATSA